MVALVTRYDMTEMFSKEDFTIVKNPGMENMKIITKEGDVRRGAQKPVSGHPVSRYCRPVVLYFGRSYIGHGEVSDVEDVFILSSVVPCKAEV